VACTRAWVVPRPWTWRWRRLARWSRAPHRRSRTGCRLIADLGRGPLPLWPLRARWPLGSLAGRLAAAASDALARAPRIGVNRCRRSLIVLPGVGPVRGRAPARRPSLLLAQLRPRPKASLSWVPSWRLWCSRVLPRSWRPRQRCAGGLVAFASSQRTSIPLSEAGAVISSSVPRAADNFSIHRHWPADFIVMCGSRHVRDEVVAAGVVVGRDFSLRFSPWSRELQSGKTSGLGCISSSPEFRPMPSINRRRLLFLARRCGWKGWVLHLLAGKI
jgi:hypothetical protein